MTCRTITIPLFEKHSKYSCCITPSLLIKKTGISYIDFKSDEDKIYKIQLKFSESLVNSLKRVSLRTNNLIFWTTEQISETIDLPFDEENCLCAKDLYFENFFFVFDFLKPHIYTNFDLIYTFERIPHFGFETKMNINNQTFICKFGKLYKYQENNN